MAPSSGGAMMGVGWGWVGVVAVDVDRVAPRSHDPPHPLPPATHKTHHNNTQTIRTRMGYWDTKMCDVNTSLPANITPITASEAYRDRDGCLCVCSYGL